MRICRFILISKEFLQQILLGVKRQIEAVDTKASEL